MKTIQIILMTLLVHLLQAQQVTRPLVAEWDRVHTWEDQLLYSIKCANGDIVLFCQPADRNLHMLRLNAAGKQLSDISFPAFRPFGRLEISSVKESKDGNLYVLLNTPERDPMIAKFSVKGQLLLAQSLLTELKRTSLSYSSSLFLKDSTVVCYGIKGGDLWEAVLDHKGSVITETIYAWEDDHYIMDIITAADGNPLILAKSETSDETGNNIGVTHLIRINNQRHTLEKWNSFPGRNASICLTSNGGYALTVDTATVSLNQSFVLHLLDHQLVLRNSVKLFDNETGISPAKISPWANGLLAITAIESGKLSLLVMDREARLQAKFSQENKEKVMLLRTVFLDEEKLGCLYEFDAGITSGSANMDWFRGKQIVFPLNKLTGKE
ncbi:hypothetical protein [Pseudobacter ginsenosidimutans]|jgi:hypothetical protein|uniref:Uncharacterized protein n=1 Tax=Pseudobacter ginsenosidimutans TaxID=661488 RepID=A0A4Q7N231_9BACT|nr:hypothetical protein [Pseudobacter ginsenosidimutans]QEC44073.1 hypothetical protein FSB84_21205 [Pseudobacter ginsenosidimutans]RZS75513.1 hypothetical protein EV199_1382 [Pseudobacter ginsenosidimutans]